MKITNLDVQGHRGCRGLYPENTIPAFVHAVKLGVQTLEFDVVISKDHQVIISHDPYMSHEISTSPDGSEINVDDEKKHNLYALTYKQIKEFDVGQKFFPKFPVQKKIPTYKPALKDVVALTENLNRKIRYNIEIKRRPENDGIFHPEYRQFADLVIAELKSLNIINRSTVQCFDTQTLKYLNNKYPDVKLVYLVENQDSISDNLGKIGFTPYVYSPYFKLVTPELVEFCKKKNMQLIPWTVNDIEDMSKMIELGVTGIISDYPDRLINLIKK